MSQAETLPFDTPLESGQDPRRRERWHRATKASAVGAPFQGSTPQSRHASYEAAKAVMAKTGCAIDQASVYWRWILAREDYGATDFEASQALGIRLSSINARRNTLMKSGHIAAAGFRPGQTGLRNTIWVAIRTVGHGDCRYCAAGETRRSA